MAGEGGERLFNMTALRQELGNLPGEGGERLPPLSQVARTITTR